MLVVRKRGYISNEDFRRLISVMRVLGAVEEGRYVWRVAEPPPWLPREAAERLVEELKGIPGVSVEGSLEAKGGGPVVRCPMRRLGARCAASVLSDEELSGLSDVLEAAHDAGGLTQVREKYDPNARRRVEVREPMYHVAEVGGLKVLYVPLGLLPRVKQLESKVGPLFRDLPTEPKTSVPLRDYQARAVKKALEQMRRYGAAVIQAATGAGKTEMGIAVLQTLEGHRPAFVVVPTRDLAVQWLERLRRYGVEAGAAFAGMFDLDKPVVVATSQTLYNAVRRFEQEGDFEGEEGEEDEGEELSEDQYKRLYDLLRRARLVVFDEAHHVPARSVKAVADAAESALFLGLSATPWRNDNRDLEIYARLGEIADRVTSTELIQKSYLVKPVIVSLVYDSSHNAAREYNAEKAKVYRDKKRAELVAEALKKAPKPFLVLAGENSAVDTAYEVLREKGFNVEKITGELSVEKRAELLDALREGKIDGLVATTLADEGLDVPNLGTLVIYGGGKSNTRVFQRIGRVIRKWPGKKAALVIDVYDKGTRFFERHAEERLRLYSKEPGWKVARAERPEDVEKAFRTAEAVRITVEPPVPKELPQPLSDFIKEYRQELRPLQMVKTWQFGPWQVTRFVAGSVEVWNWTKPMDRKKKPLVSSLR